MKTLSEWLKSNFGRKLIKLHFWNAWLVLVLAITGIVLFLPIRGELGATRVGLKWGHIGLGVVSTVVVLIYLPILAKHWKQLRNKPAQRWNLAFVMFLLVGWILSGAVLSFFKMFPPIWANIALGIHDLFTWVGVPYAIYHSISRSRWVKRANIATTTESEAEITPRKFPISRRGFIRVAAGTALVLGLGPAFYKWLKSMTDDGGAALQNYIEGDENRMLPAIKPLPESVQVIGGGGTGTFRIYTVTDIPKFTSDNWKFDIKGLVDKPQSWNWEEFLKLKRKVQVSDFHCVTGWSVYHLTWEGIMLSDLLKMANVKSNAKFVKFYSGDGVYTDTLTLEQAHMEDVMVAVLIDGKAIPQQLGGPVRLIVPKMYAYKSVKWLQSIELIEKEHVGYWELRGYDTDAWV